VPTQSYVGACSKSAAPPLLPSYLANGDWDVVHRVPINTLRPTQSSVGMKSVSAKVRRIGFHLSNKRKFDRYLERRAIPVVLGPGRDFYMIDRHHLGMALHQSEVTEAYVAVLADFSAISRGSFFSCMERNGLLHPFDRSGKRIKPARLPKRIADLAHDPYRDLAWSVRRLGGFKKTAKPFSEFRWADFFRTRIAPETIERDYDKAVRSALQLARTRQARALPGFAA